MEILWKNRLDAIGATKENVKEHSLSVEQVEQIERHILQELEGLFSRLQKRLLWKEDDNCEGNGCEDDGVPGNKVNQQLFFLLEAYIVTGRSFPFQELQVLIEYLVKFLDFKQIDGFNWMSDEEQTEFSDLYYYRLRILAIVLKYVVENEAVVTSEQMLKLISIASMHVHPALPWTSSINSAVIRNCIEQCGKLQQMIFCKLSELVDEVIKPKLLSLSPSNGSNKGSSKSSLSNPKLTSTGYSQSMYKKSSSMLHGGLRPKLGYGGAVDSMVEEEQRRKWKQSADVKCISMVWFVIYIMKLQGKPIDKWPLITSFLLNLFDDHDPLFKAQSCRLLSFLIKETYDPSSRPSYILVRSGLLQLFEESTKTCLAYIPNLTPPDQSLYLLQIAYLTVYLLLDMNQDDELKSLKYVDLINSSILSSILHIFTGSGEQPIQFLQLFLMQQLQIIITDVLKTKIIITFPRILHVLNTFVVNIPLLETGVAGQRTILTALSVQRAIIDEFNNLNESDGSRLMLNYKYDFMGSWYALRKHQAYSKQTETTTQILQALEKNFASLQALSAKCGPEEANKLDQELGRLSTYGEAQSPA